MSILEKRLSFEKMEEPAFPCKRLFKNTIAPII